MDYFHWIQPAKAFAAWYFTWPWAALTVVTCVVAVWAVRRRQRRFWTIFFLIQLVFCSSMLYLKDFA